MMVCAECGAEKVSRMAGTKLLCGDCGEKRDAAIKKEDAAYSKGIGVALIMFILLLLMAKFLGCGN